MYAGPNVNNVFSTLYQSLPDILGTSYLQQTFFILAFLGGLMETLTSYKKPLSTLHLPNQTPCLWSNFDSEYYECSLTGLIA